VSLKKTLFLTEFYPPLVGGSCNMFAWRFQLYPPDCIVVLTKLVEHSQDFDKNLKYLVKRVPLRRRGPKGFEWLGLVWELIKAGISLARQHHVEVIQCARPFPEGLAGYVIAKLLRKKLVLNAHGDDIAQYQNYPVERVLMNLVIRVADLNLANSTFTASLIKQQGGREGRIAIVTPGFDPAPLQQVEPANVSRLRERLGGTPIILTVGRIQRHKGQDYVIQALPEVLKRFPDVTYVIVGPLKGWPPGYAETLLHLAEQSGVSQHVILVGEVDITELPLYYLACDVFVMPNRLVPPGDVEGFGIVFLEASSLGKPVIGGNSGGVSDAIQHGKTGLLVNGDSVSDIAQGILTVLSDPKLAQEMGEQGKVFALSMTHEQVFQRYQEVMSKHGL
jgi:phosphatidylinositol alpha-1,6-mannosyltransferase